MNTQLILILNRPAADYESGGNVREWALALWAEKRGVQTWIVQDSRYQRSRGDRLLALPRLLARQWRHPRAVFILGYPGIPFFWSLDSVPQLLRAFLFVAGCKLVGLVRGQRIVVDIMDLIRFQHIDLKYEVRLPKWLFRLFDWCVYHLATELWVCSSGIAERIRAEMLWGQGRVRVVENGAFPSSFDDSAPRSGLPRVFMYAGQLYQTRGVSELIKEFLRCNRDDVELRLCGVGGEWIPGHTSDKRIKYLGQLNEDDCARAVSEIDMGIVFQPRGQYYDMVYPTKLPLYIARGKSVLAADNPELSRAVAEKRVGIVTSLENLAATIDALSPESVAGFGANARALRSQVYWDAIYDRAYEQITERPLIAACDEAAKRGAASEETRR